MRTDAIDSAAGEAGAARAARPAALLAAQPGPDEILSRRTELVLRELEGLPTLASVAARLLALGSRDDADVKEVVRIVESDPALTVRLLALCRRAAYRTRVPITTVEMAVVMLGLDAVRSLALSVEIFDWTARADAARRRPGAVGHATARGRASTRPAPDRPGDAHAPAFDRSAFWQHSIAVACCAELIAREHAELELAPEECFTCGLVHDLGKVALELVLPRAYARVVELAEARRGNIADFERPIVGLDHHQAGARLAERWRLPEAIAAAMARHDRPYAAGADDPHRRLLAVVHVADAVCRRLSLGWSGNHAPPPDERALAREAGLRPERVLAVVPRLYEATSARMKDLGLGDEPSQRMLIESILRANSRLGRANQDLIEANARLEAAQRELAEARAMARLGEMTAGAAHEMNNPLAVISGRAQGLAARARDEQDRSAARAVVDAAARLTALISRLNRIAGPPAPEPDVVDLRALLEEAVRDGKDAFGDRLQARGAPLAGSGVMGVKLTVAEGLEAARLDGPLVREALVEILVNALEAGPRSRVEVRAEVDRPTDRLCLRVVDDGIGMNAHALEHATDPFFSAKPAGRQTGLGLALAHRLVRACGGDVMIASRPGRGTAVTVSLPDWRAGAGARVARRAPRGAAA